MKVQLKLWSLDWRIGENLVEKLPFEVDVR